MMKTLLTIALLLFASFYYSQSYYASYQEKFTIEVAEDDVHTYRVYLNMASLDTTINHVGISMTKEELSGFVEVLETVERKYIEWKKVAIENSVTELSKKVKNSVVQFRAYFEYEGKWYFDGTWLTSFNYKIIDFFGVRYLMTFQTGKIISTDNYDIKSKGGQILFQSLEEIIDLKTKLSDTEISKFLNVDDLFKD